MSFKIGDRVRVVKLGFGIDSPIYLGKEFTVKRIDPTDWVRLEGDTLGFIWHPSLLELVEDDDIIRVGDLVEPIPVEELPSPLNLTDGNISMQKVLLSKGVWPKVVEEITTGGNPRIYLEGDRPEWYNGLYLARFRKVKTSVLNDPNRKYIKVITKIREMKKRRENLGYEY